MSPETRLFLLIAPPHSPSAPIGVTCAIIGNSNEMHGIESEFSGRRELEKTLEKAGLPEFEIARAVQRVKRNSPTFCEITIETAEKLRLIKRSGNVAASSDGEGVFYPTRHSLRIRSGVSVMRGPSLV
jgi:hypothetical protein